MGGSRVSGVYLGLIWGVSGDRTSIEHLPNIYRTSIERLSNIYRTSIEHLWIGGVSGVYLKSIWVDLVWIGVALRCIWADLTYMFPKFQQVLKLVESRENCVIDHACDIMEIL